MCKERFLMDPHKIEAIQHANHPQNIKEFLSFLGMENFYQRYIKDFVVRMKPLKHLLKRIGSFHWTTKWESTFRQELQATVIRRPILIPLNWTKEFHVHINAWPQYLGLFWPRPWQQGGSSNWLCKQVLKPSWKKLHHHGEGNISNDLCGEKNIGIIS